MIARRFSECGPMVRRLVWEREQVSPCRKSKNPEKPCNIGIFGTLQNLKKA
jgi:hypothetical protein